MKFVIAVIGEAGHGKDTVTNFIKDIFNNVDVVRVSKMFKDITMTDLNIESLEQLEHYKRYNILHNGHNIRKYLQNLTDEIIDNYGFKYIGKNVIADIEESNSPIVVIPDIRYHEIEDMISEKYKGNYISIKVIRDGYKINESNHRSEKNIESIVTQFTIHNNDGLNELRYVTRNLIKSIAVKDYRLKKEIKDVKI